MRYDNKSFFGETVSVCGNEYHGCTFTRCTIVFRGDQSTALVECLFQQPKWVLEGPAANTLRFLTTMYHKLGEPGVRLVEETFNNIRLNKEYNPSL
jgi:hypothetical protein